MNNIELALLFMIRANKGKKFKFDDIDKTFHSVCVGNTMMRIKGVTEEYIVAGILHDIINDTEYGYEDIEQKFGKEVAEIVFEISEDMSIAKWLDRKKDYVKRLRKNKDPMILNIVVADKINYLKMLDASVKGIDKISKYSGGSITENRYLYREIYNICLNANCDLNLMKEYNSLLIRVFGESEF